MGMWRKGNPPVLLVGMQTGAAAVENSMQFPQKIKNGTVLWCRDATSENISEKTWNTNLKGYTHLCVHCNVIYNRQDLEAAQVFINGWMDKIAVVRLCSGILLSHKKEGNLTLWDRMDRLGEYSAKWNNPVREREVPCGFTYMWDLMSKIN